MTSIASLTVIIPTLNEQQALAEQRADLESLAAVAQLIVVDGGSDDQTLERARAIGGLVLASERGRAIQMNLGAASATGEYLLFLHADTRLPPNFFDCFQLWSRAEPEWGFFPVRLSGGHALLRVIEWGINLRSRLFGRATGDQCLLLKRELFERLGGYAEIELMEDVVLCRCLQKYSAARVFDMPVVTSSRRWEKHGILKTVFLMWYLRILFRLGVEPAHLAQKYS